MREANKSEHCLKMAVGDELLQSEQGMGWVGV